MPTRPLDHFSPPTWPSADVSDIDPVWKPHKRGTDRAGKVAKRRRIEDHALTYILGEPLLIQSAALQGPFDKETWSNPWRSTGYDVHSEELSADPIEETAQVSNVLKSTKKQPSEPDRPVIPKASRPPTRKQNNGKMAMKPLPPVAPPETTWLRKSITLAIEHDAVQDDPPESTPSKPAPSTKSTNKRPAKGVKAKTKAAPKRKITRKTAKAGQAQLPLVNVSKLNQPPPSKSIETEAARSNLIKMQQSVPKPFIASVIEPPNNNHVAAGPSEIDRSLARIERNLKQGMTKENDRKRRFMTFTSPHVVKDSPHKRRSVEMPVVQEAKSPGPPSIPPILHDPDPIEASFVLDNQQTAGATEIPVQEQAEASAPVPADEAPQLVDVSNASVMADAALHVLSTGTAFQHQPAPAAVASNSGTIMNDSLNEKLQNNVYQPPRIVQEESSEHVRVSSYPEHQDSRAYSPTSLDMTTQTALHQAQMDFHAQFADESPSLLSIGLPRNSVGQMGATITPARTLRKSQRLSLNALGSTQDLIQAAQQVDFNSTKKSTTIKKGKRPSLVQWVPPTRLSPPGGSDENKDPSHLSRMQNAVMSEIPKPSSQQPSSQNRVHGVPLQDISSQQSNSQHSIEEHNPLPTISFMPSAGHSVELKISGAPAASWQIGQGQPVLDEMDKSFDLNRSLDEALEFLNVDYEF